MFVNDTGRLPESGRVCVRGFQSSPGGAPRWYAITINAARAEVEPMAEPRNAWHVLGVGNEFTSTNGPVFAAYFAAARDRYEAEPNYKSGLFVLVDGAVYAVRQEQVATSIRRGFGARTFTLLRGDRPQRGVVYPWPWYREPFAAAGGSRDFMRQLSEMVRIYG